MKVDSLNSQPMQRALSGLLLCFVVVAAFRHAHALESNTARGDIGKRLDAASARIWADADDISEDEIVERLAKWHAAKESIITKALAKEELTATAAEALRRSIVRDELNGLRGLLGERDDDDDEDWDDDDEQDEEEDEDEDELTLNAAQKRWRHGPENNHYGIRLSASEYAKMVEPELGIPPVVDCGENVEIPIFVDGKKYVGDPGIHCCDNPSLQMGDCMSGSSLGRHEGRTRDGKRLPDVVWVSFARHDGRANVFGHEVGNSVQLIGYNKKTGATAFFEGGDNSRWVRADPKTNRLVGVLPGIDNLKAFDHAYSTPGATQCVECHQNDPFIHNPFIDAARLPGDPSQPVVPEIAGPETPYYVIGAKHWDMRTIHIKGNSCFECHRIGMKTIEEFIGDGWDPNNHMPPGDPGSMKKDFDELLRAWIKGPEKTPGCDWIIPPAGDAPTRVVNDEYPFKAWFNQPNRDAIRKLNRKPRRIPEPSR